MLAAGRQVQKLRFQTIATGLNVIFNGVLIPLLAVEGAILASVVSIAVNAFLLVRYLRRYSPERLMQRLATDVVPLFAVGLLAAGVGAYMEVGEVWAAVAFIISFIGAAVISGFLSMIWAGVTRLIAQEG
jgi:O-antigen/teichoic acid export membrane protein